MKQQHWNKPRAKDLTSLMKADAEPTVVSAAGWRARAKTSSSSWEGEGREDSLTSAGRGMASLMAACAEIPHVPAKGCGEHWHQALLCPLVFEYRGWSGAGLHFHTPPGCQGGGGRKGQLQKMHTPFHIYLHEMTKWLQTGWGTVWEEMWRHQAGPMWISSTWQDSAERQAQKPVVRFLYFHPSRKVKCSLPSMDYSRSQPGMWGRSKAWVL